MSIGSVSNPCGESESFSDQLPDALKQAKEGLLKAVSALGGHAIGIAARVIVEGVGQVLKRAKVGGAEREAGGE